MQEPCNTSPRDRQAHEWSSAFAAKVVTTAPGEYAGEVECLINGEAVDLRGPDEAIGWQEDMRLLLTSLFVRAHNAGAQSILGNLSEHVSEHPRCGGDATTPPDDAAPPPPEPPSAKHAADARGVNPARLTRGAVCESGEPCEGRR